MTDQPDSVAGFLTALSDEQRIVLGECIAQAALLEGLLRSAVMWLMEPKKQNDAVLTLLSGESSSWLEGKARIFAEVLPEPFRTEWKAWLSQVREALDARNRLAHTSWLVTSSGGTTHGRRQRRGVVSQGETATLQDMVRIRTKLIQARVDGRSLIKRLRA